MIKLNNCRSHKIRQCNLHDVIRLIHRKLKRVHKVSCKMTKAIFAVHVSKNKISFFFFLTHSTFSSYTEPEANISRNFSHHLWSTHISQKYLELVEYTVENSEVYTGGKFSDNFQLSLHAFYDLFGVNKLPTMVSTIYI